MTVFIEYVLIDNFVIDWLLLKATFALTRCRAKKVGLIIAPLIGAVCALTYPLLTDYPVVLYAIKLSLGFLMVAIAGAVDTLKSFMINSAVFFCCTFALGGAVTGVFNLLGLSADNEISIALMFLPAGGLCFLLLHLIKFLYRRKNITANIVRVKILLMGKEIEASGLIDTGNTLYDGAKPVVVASGGLAKRMLAGLDSLPHTGSIEISTLTGKAKKPTLKIDGIKIYTDKKVHIHNNVTLCVAGKISGGGYDLIVHPALIGGSDDRGYSFDTEKAG